MKAKILKMPMTCPVCNVTKSLKPGTVRRHECGRPYLITNEQAQGLRSTLRPNSPASKAAPRGK